MINKETLYSQLPLKINEFIIRKRTRKDIDLRCNWPSYPEPFKLFNSSLRNCSQVERDQRFSYYENSKNLIVLSVDHPKQKLMGIYSLNDIQWDKMVINNMGIRIHPEWCNFGYGSKKLTSITNWCFNNNFKRIRLDVAENNMRAINAYKKSKFKVVDNIIINGNKHLIMEIIKIDS